MAKNKSGNSSLAAANAAKQDEFYTRLEDIESELRHYEKHFEGKTVLCNCDDPFESNFFRYFVLKFNSLKLKKLICTCYRGSSVAYKQLSLFDLEDEESEEEETIKRTPYKAIVTKVHDTTGDGGIDMNDVANLFKNGENELTKLQGDGDFRSDECLKLLDEADIVVTNPPFSLFREYVSTLMEKGKQFLIIGNQNAISYKEIFPLIKENRVWLGFHSGDMAFKVPDYYEERETRYWQDGSGQKWRSLGNVCWFTNLDHSKRHEELVLFKHYNQDEFPKYDNYDAIEVSKASDIPCDYFGVMGVPITFLDKFNPDQFKLLGISKTWDVDNGLKCKMYPRQIQIGKDGKKTTDVTKLNDGPVIKHASPPPGTTYYIVDGEFFTQGYARVFIKRKGLKVS